MNFKKNSKRALSLFLSLLMIVTVVPFAFAEGTEICTHNPTYYEQCLAKQATCVEAGLAYDCYWCTECQEYVAEKTINQTHITDDVVLPATGKHTAQSAPVAAKEATCTEDGNIAYYRCGVCKNWIDVANNAILDKVSDAYIPAGHTVEEKPAKEATCTENGNKAYFECLTCGAKLAEADDKDEIAEETFKSEYVVPALNHDMKEIIVPSTCKELGYTYTACQREYCGYETEKVYAEEYADHIFTDVLTCDSTEEESVVAYKYCAVCEKYFDNAGEKELTKFEAEEIAHTLGLHRLYSAPDCVMGYAGTKEYYICSSCDKYVLAADGKVVEEKDYDAEIIIPYTHTFEDVSEVTATCEETGVKAHKKCSVCSKLFTADTENPIETTQEKLVLPLVSHIKSTTEAYQYALSATCTAEGKVECWLCNMCGKFIDADNELIENGKITIDALGHKKGTEVKEVPATCEADGTKAYWICGNEGCEVKLVDGEEEGTLVVIADEAIVIKGGHILSEESVPAVPATCVNAGTVEYWTCTRENCGKNFDKDGKELESITEEINPANHAKQLGHYKGTPATCLEDGVKEHYHCSACDKNFADEAGTELLESLVIEKAGQHVSDENWVDVEGEEADCENAGKEKSKCKVCGEDIIRDKEKLDHDYQYVVKTPASCLSNKIETVTCSRCDYTDEQVTLGTMLAHSYTAEAEHIDDTKTHHRKCVNGCEKYDKAENCTFGEWITVIEASCEGTGVMKQICSVCNYEVTKDVEANGHDYKLVEEVKATCETDGTEAYNKCKNCDKLFDTTKDYNEIKTPVVISKDTVPHDIIGYECTDENWFNDEHTVICSVCGKFTESHKDKYEVVVDEEQPGSCTEPQKYSLQCKECKDLIQNLYDSENYGSHIITHVEAVKALCGTDETAHDGNIEYWYCTREGCGKYFSDEALTKEITLEETIIKKGETHQYGEEQRKDPTCTENGYVGMECTICKYVKGEEIPAAGHDFQSTGIIGDCTATEVKKTFKCTRCDETKEEILTDVVGNHTFGPEKEVVKAPTCTEDGVKANVCSICKSLKDEEVIPAEGHCDIKDAEEGKCTKCGILICDCDCHTATGWRKILFQIILFFQKLIGTNKTCVCGVSH